MILRYFRCIGLLRSMAVIASTAPKLSGRTRRQCRTELRSERTAAFGIAGQLGERPKTGRKAEQRFTRWASVGLQFKQAHSCSPASRRRTGGRSSHRSRPHAQTMTPSGVQQLKYRTVKQTPAQTFARLTKSRDGWKARLCHLPSGPRRQ